MVGRSSAKRIVGLIGSYFVSNLIHDLRLVLEKADTAFIPQLAEVTKQ